VEDIVDTGLTMRYLLDNLAPAEPASVKLLHAPDSAVRARGPPPAGGGDFFPPPIRTTSDFQVEDGSFRRYGLDAPTKYASVPVLGVLPNG